MRIYCIAAFIVFASPAFACTAGGVPCDQVYREQLETIDRNRTENYQRQERIEQQQHQNNLARIKREQELQAARGGSAQPQTQAQPQIQPSTNAQLPAECRAFPAMCSAYK